MATASGRSLCFKYNKDKPTYTCGGCGNNFCKTHLQEHRQALNGQLDEIINEHDQFKQTMNEQNPVNSLLIEKIDQWEKTSVETIKRTAQECREIVIDQTRKVIDKIEKKLGELTSQLRHVREENEFNEIDLKRSTNKLTELTESSNIVIQEDSQTLIHKIHVCLANSTQRQENDWLSETPGNEPFTPQSKESLSPRADPQLVKLFKSVNDQGTTVTDSEIIGYIRQNMDPNEKFYIRNIVLSYLEACLINRDPQKKIQEDIAKKRMTILNTIIKHKPEAEIQAVYAIQHFVNKLEHPPKMARLLFDIFHDEECVSEDAFFDWLKHPDESETEGHEVVKMSTKDFFTWLQQAETEVEEGEEEGS